MASLSDFKVNTGDAGSRNSDGGRSAVDVPPPPISPAVQVEADYAKVEKHTPPSPAQKPKGEFSRASRFHFSPHEVSM